MSILSQLSFKNRFRRSQCSNVNMHLSWPAARRVRLHEQEGQTATSCRSPTAACQACRTSLGTHSGPNLLVTTTVTSVFCIWHRCSDIYIWEPKQVYYPFQVSMTRALENLLVAPRRPIRDSLYHLPHSFLGVKGENEPVWLQTLHRIFSLNSLLYILKLSFQPAYLL